MARFGVFSWYNIGWQKTRFNQIKRHEADLKADLYEALEEKACDVVFLVECGEIGIGLGSQWVNLVRKLCGPGFVVTHQSHFTSIVRYSTVQVLQEPSLKGPLCEEHDYRMCQHMQVQFRDSAEKPIDLFSIHSPSSGKRSLGALVREQILEWFCKNAGSRALIGGDLNSSKLCLDITFKKCRDIGYCYEEDHKHGDLVVAKGLKAATSVPCEAQATSDAHKMCIVMLKIESARASYSISASKDSRFRLKRGQSDSEQAATLSLPSASTRARN